MGTGEAGGEDSVVAIRTLCEAYHLRVCLCRLSVFQVKTLSCNPLKPRTDPALWWDSTCALIKADIKLATSTGSILVPTGRGVAFRSRRRVHPQSHPPLSVTKMKEPDQHFDAPLYRFRGCRSME